MDEVACVGAEGVGVTLVFRPRPKVQHFGPRTSKVVAVSGPKRGVK